MAEVDELTRRARRAESDGEPREALRLYREALEADPDQRTAVRTARLLERAGRTDEALDVLRETWEARTGLRLPAGDIERAARRLDPDADLASWTPEWPPAGEGAGAADRVARAVEPPEPAVDDVDDVEDADGAPSRRFVRRYDRRPGGGGDGEDGPRRLEPRDRPSGGSDGDAGAPGAGDGRAPDGGRAPGSDGSGAEGGGREARAPAAANGAGDLRRGLELLEELLELSPRDRRLRRRKVRYARRMEDPDLLETALVELGDLLDEEGAHRGARLLYEEAGSPDAASGPGDVDDEFRRRLSEALERAPRELERLQSAGMEALGAEGAGDVPWQAHRELGRFLLLRGRPDEAARHLAAARDRAPEGGEEAADVLYDLGVAHRRAGRRREARDCFRRLADRDPGFAVAWEALSG